MRKDVIEINELINFVSISLENDVRLVIRTQWYSIDSRHARRDVECL